MFYIEEFLFFFLDSMIYSVNISLKLQFVIQTAIDSCILTSTIVVNNESTEVKIWYFLFQYTFFSKVVVYDEDHVSSQEIHKFPERPRDKINNNQ